MDSAEDEGQCEGKGEVMKELALHIMDIIQNSLTAGSLNIDVDVYTCDEDRFLDIAVCDDGCGMDEKTLNQAADPFHTSRKTRDVGLGIPMFREAAIMSGGNFAIKSEPGAGTELRCRFLNRSVDRQPLGELGNVVFLNMLSNEGVRFRLHLASSRGEYSFDSREFAASICEKGGSFMDAAFDAELCINEKTEAIFGGILPEMGGELFGAERNNKTDKRQAAV